MKGRTDGAKLCKRLVSPTDHALTITGFLRLSEKAKLEAAYADRHFVVTGRGDSDRLRVVTPPGSNFAPCWCKPRYFHKPGRLETNHVNMNLVSR
jgi:hypothetical protein